MEEVLVSGTLIDNLWANKSISLDEIEIPHQSTDNNTYILLRSTEDCSKTAIARITPDRLVVYRFAKKRNAVHNIVPRNAEQCAFLDCLIDRNIPLNVALGPAGTGKTLLSVAFAIDTLYRDGTCIKLSKSTHLVGPARAFGPVPGDIQGKFLPYLGSYEIILNELLGVSYLSVLLRRKEVEYIPFQFVRGYTFKNCTFILDEVQNLTWHEVKTVVSRMGENAKLILLGDLDQIDRRFVRQKPGVVQLVESNAFKCSSLTSCITFTKQYRSDLCQLIAEVDHELRSKSTSR